MRRADVRAGRMLSERTERGGPGSGQARGHTSKSRRQMSAWVGGPTDGRADGRGERTGERVGRRRRTGGRSG